MPISTGSPRRARNLRRGARARLTATYLSAATALRQRAEHWNKHPDEGMTTFEYLMWIGIIVVAVGVIGAIVVGLLTAKAHSINLN